MRGAELKKLSTSELAARFRDYALQQEGAQLDGDTGKYRGLYQKMESIDAELRARGQDARRALLPLLNEQNMRVRYEAAVRLLAIVPDRARAVLEEIAKSQVMPEAGDAGMMLLNLQKGIFKPT
jgi:Domain of unknown function (DUF2019)